MLYLSHVKTTYLPTVMKVLSEDSEQIRKKEKETANNTPEIVHKHKVNAAGFSYWVT